MLQVVFELETTAPVTWSRSDVTSSDVSNSSRVLLLKGEMRYMESMRLVIFLCKPLWVGPRFIMFYYAAVLIAALRVLPVGLSVCLFLLESLLENKKASKTQNWRKRFSRQE